MKNLIKSGVFMHVCVYVCVCVCVCVCDKERERGRERKRKGERTKLFMFDIYARFLCEGIT